MSSSLNSLLYIYDFEAEEEETKNNGGQGGACTWEMDLLQFMFESFNYLFPTKDCCHDANGFSTLRCVCEPCGDESLCQACKYRRNAADWDSCSAGGAVDESKREEEDDDIREYNQIIFESPSK
jgi:hypothetical protein